MYKTVKNKTRKYYCDKCGKNICDYILSNPPTVWWGSKIHEFILKKAYCDYKLGMFKDYCLECYEKEQGRL